MFHVFPPIEVIKIVQLRFKINQTKQIYTIKCKINHYIRTFSHNTMSQRKKFSSSFRDPAGFIFEEQGTLYRQINQSYEDEYQQLIKSQLYEVLTKRQMLIPHEEMSHTVTQDDRQFLVIKPKKIPFISYPYEWSFSQLKQAALLTLNCQLIALKHGMTLKDASNYNIQFYQGFPIFIDTLSFERYVPNQPWQAYKQFCQHFIAPLLLMVYKDVRLNQLLKIYIDGIPLDLASKLLPRHTFLNPGILFHLHLHAKLQQKHAANGKKPQKQKFSKEAFIFLINNLKKIIQKLQWKIEKNSEWYDYYDSNNNYVDNALESKLRIVNAYFQRLQVTQVWDLGANTGKFSEIAAKYAECVIAWDIDDSCVEQHFLKLSQNTKTNILPLKLDLTNPSSNIGWHNQERASLLERAPCDCVLALGLMHHLTITNNVPFPRLSHFFSDICNYLIIEFVPFDDSQVQILTETRDASSIDYSQSFFEYAFGEHFSILDKAAVSDSKRTLYLMKRI